MALPTDKPSFGVLDGVKVVYSAVEIAAPTAAAIMGEWGADVTWIENVWTGDSMRDTAWVKEMERRNMRSISMNPFTDEGKEALRAIVKDADIFIESGKGPMYARKGITDEFLWEINPKLVIVHVSGFGQYGDEEQINSAAYDLTVAAYAGIVTQNGSPDQPMNISPYLGDYINSLMIISSSLAALHRVQVTGEGESIDMAMYETKDGYIGLCLYGVPQNKYLLETIGLGHLWGTDEYPEGTSALWLDSPKADLIQETLEAYLKTQSKYDVQRDFVAHRIAAQVVNEFGDILDAEHVQARECFIEWENAEGKTIKGLNTFPKFRRNPGAFWRPMPALGGDTRDILKRAGYADEAIDALIASGTVKAADED